MDEMIDALAEPDSMCKERERTKMIKVQHVTPQGAVAGTVLIDKTKIVNAYAADGQTGCTLFFGGGNNMCVGKKNWQDTFDVLETLDDIQKLLQ